MNEQFSIIDEFIMLGKVGGIIVSALAGRWTLKKAASLFIRKSTPQQKLCKEIIKALDNSSCWQIKDSSGSTQIGNLTIELDLPTRRITIIEDGKYYFLDGNNCRKSDLLKIWNKIQKLMSADKNLSKNKNLDRFLKTISENIYHKPVNKNNETKLECSDENIIIGDKFLIPPTDNFKGGLAEVVKLEENTVWVKIDGKEFVSPKKFLLELKEKPKFNVGDVIFLNSVVGICTVVGLRVSYNNKGIYHQVKDQKGIIYNYTENSLNIGLSSGEIFFCNQTEQSIDKKTQVKDESKEKLPILPSKFKIGDVINFPPHVNSFFDDGDAKITYIAGLQDVNPLSYQVKFLKTGILNNFSEEILLKISAKPKFNVGDEVTVDGIHYQVIRLRTAWCENGVYHRLKELKLGSVEVEYLEDRLVATNTNKSQFIYN